MEPIRKVSANQRQLSRREYNRLVEQHNCMTSFIGQYAAGTERAIQICGRTLVSPRITVIDRSTEAFWSEVVRIPGADDQIKVFGGHVAVGGHFDFQEVLTTNVTVTASGFVWLQATKQSSPTISFGTAPTLPDASSSSFYLWRICTFTVDSQSATITGRDVGDKYAHSVIGADV